MSFFRSSRELPRMGALSQKRPTIVSVLDVGTSKICCVIGKLTPRDPGSALRDRTHTVEVMGLGYQRSLGIKAGVIIDLEQAEYAIRQAVDAAERMAGVTIDSLIVNISSGRLGSQTWSSQIEIGGREVEAGDVRAVLSAGGAQPIADDRSVLHSLPIGYTLDGESKIRDPRGMMANVVGVDMHVVNAETAPIRNLELCINRAHLSVEAMVATPYASGLAALVDDESEMGCACIDMGGGTTTLSVFLERHFVFADAIAVGGNHVTMDLARGLSTRVEDAERLKVLHGSATESRADESDMVAIPPMGDEERDLPYTVSKAQLSRIVRPRLEETFELIRDRLYRSGFARAVGKRIVLTGGASQLAGAGTIAHRILGSEARLGRPMGVSHMPKAAKGPAFSTVTGLLIYPQVAQIEQFASVRSGGGRLAGTGGAFTRMGQWLKESF